ncbi:glycoside hydrolase family 15 protein [Patescibacteria group bacterium]|nr:glycoside hydrolase family 15 protein [Patescibacteria group bacterium]MBU1682339.1 glycoside hydrolase family 15 protein [Patescibacteria group bacterium]MBU1934805.1 glycoside hydrolase family 15 protein [Patescibacteria group bacterium]
MPREIVTGNGNCLVAIDKNNMLQDLYFPYVGMEDHISFKHMHRMGVYMDNQFSWLYESSWKHKTSYIEDALVTDAEIKNEKLQLDIHLNDFVYPDANVFLRKLTIHNNSDRDRNVKVFFSQDLHIYGDKQQDTAFYEPEYKAVIHYRKNRYFLVSGMYGDKQGIDSFATGKSEYRGLEGTWRDAEDGHLQEGPIDQGSVDSTVEFDLPIKGNSKAVLYFWICAGKNRKEVMDLHNFILIESPERLLGNTINYWHSWVNKEKHQLSHVTEEIKRRYKQSLLITRTQIDNRGAIIAANDSDIMKFNKDTYTYMWPRDGAWVALSLDHAGYGEISKRFFKFCADVMNEDGYLFHKFNPDKSLGSSWHPWYKDGKKHLPLQEDETAIVLYALGKHFEYYGDIEFIQEMYIPLIRPAGNFITQYIDFKTNLPLPCYDLWERIHGVFAYTAASIYAGLKGAAYLCKKIGHFNHNRRYNAAAENIKEAILTYLYDEEKQRFLSRIIFNPETGEITKDYTIDASMHGLWMLGVLPPDDPRVINTNKAIYETLKVNTHVGGLARFENDDYQRVSGDYRGIPGNPWIITTLWHAQWLIALAKTKEDLKPVDTILRWTMGHMNKAGILPEQFSPFTGEHLSVAPLTWSHSTFVETVLQYNKKIEELEA